MRFSTDPPQILTSFLTFIHPHRNTQLVCCFWANQWHMWDPGQKFNSFFLRTEIERQRISWVYWENVVDKKEEWEREKALLFWRNKTLLAPFFLDNSTLLFTTDEQEVVSFLNISWVGGREHSGSSGRADHQCITEVYTIFTHSNTHSHSTFLTQAWS